MAYYSTFLSLVVSDFGLHYCPFDVSPPPAATVEDSTWVSPRLPLWPFTRFIAYSSNHFQVQPQQRLHVFSVLGYCFFCVECRRCSCACCGLLGRRQCWGEVPIRLLTYRYLWCSCWYLLYSETQVPKELMPGERVWLSVLCYTFGVKFDSLL